MFGKLNDKVADLIYRKNKTYKVIYFFNKLHGIDFFKLVPYKMIKKGCAFTKQLYFD